MLEYLLNPDYRVAKQKFDQTKSKINKLKRINDDLMNDSVSVSDINRRIDYICDDFEKAVLISDVRERVTTKLDALKEPNQGSDGNLRSASNYVFSEMVRLTGQMKDAESAMNNIKNTKNGSW